MSTSAEPAYGADHSLPALTGLRGLAALWVLVYHAWVYVGPQAILFDFFGNTIRAHVFFSLGWAGVQLLFVLSGFLLTLPYARANAGLAPRPRVSRYLLKRISRVFPAYYTQLIILVVILGLATQHWIVDAGNLVQYLLMLFIPPPVGLGSPVSINGVWWTLPIELSFYLCLPVLSALAHQHRKGLLLLVSMLSMVAWRWYVVDVVSPTVRASIWVYQLPGSMDGFGMGMLGAVLHVQYTEQRQSFDRYRQRLLALLWVTPVVFVLLGIWMAADYAIYWSGAPILYLWTPLFNAAVLVLILNCAQQRNFLDRLLANRPVFYLGTVSYGLYLWHAPLGLWLLQTPMIAAMDGYQFPRMALLMFCSSLLLASLSWYLVEARAIAMARRRPPESG